MTETILGLHYRFMFTILLLGFGALAVASKWYTSILVLLGWILIALMIAILLNDVVMLWYFQKKRRSEDDRRRVHKEVLKSRKEELNK